MNIYVRQQILLLKMYAVTCNNSKSLSNLINNKNIVILAADKETCTVILNRTDYQNKVNNMINEGITEGKYIETVEHTHKGFLFRNLYKHDQYENMLPKSNQPGRFFATAETKLNCVQL